MSEDTEEFNPELNIPMWERATPIEGWHMVRDGLPELGAEVEILHFGNCPVGQFGGTATVDQWGICPHAGGGGHGKRSTVTHWRDRETS